MIGAGVTVAGLISWSLEKAFGRVRWRDTLLSAVITGVCIYIALTVDSLLLR